MSQKRYGIFIPPFGYVYDGAVWEEQLKFTPDATKAAINKSYVHQADAQSYVDAINSRYPTAQLAKFVMQASAELIPNKSPEERQKELEDEYAPMKAEYYELFNKYEGYSPAEWETIPTQEWKRYTAIKHRLQIFGLLP